MKQRVNYLDLAKGIGIILVVLGHMENIDESIRIWIASFHMPLFFIISGMLISLKGEDKKLLIENGVDNSESGSKKSEFIVMLKKKTKGIIVPYLWFSLIYIPIDIMNLYINHIDQHTFIQNILDSFTFSGISVMWFLPALFIAEVVALALIRKFLIVVNGENKTVKFTACVLLISLIISLISYFSWDCIRPLYEKNSGNYVLCTLLGFVRMILRGLSMSFHVIIGYLMFNLIKVADLRINNYFDRIRSEKKKQDIVNVSNSVTSIINKELRKEKDGSKGISLALGLIFTFINLGLCIENGAVDNHFMIFNNLFYYYLCAILGSVGIILLCKGFDSIKPIDFLGKNSLIIMATHLQCYLLYAGILVAIAIDAYVTRAKSYVYMFNSVLFTMLFETVVIVIINKLFPFIIGKGSIKDSLSIFKKKDKN